MGDGQEEEGGTQEGRYLVLQVRRQAVGCCFYCSGSVLLCVCVLM